VVTPSTWASLDADLRSFIEVYLFAVVILLSVPAGRLGARFGWMLPALAVWMIPALAGVLQRRLTISFQALCSAVRSAPGRRTATAREAAIVSRMVVARLYDEARVAPSVSCP
jgi:hypothetical protein